MRIAWVTVGATTDPIDGYVFPSYVTEVAGRLTAKAASLRLRLLIPMAELAARGHEVALLRPDSSSFDDCVARVGEFDAMVFSKTFERGEFVIELFNRAMMAGTPTLFDVCDAIDEASDSGRRNLKMLSEASTVVSSTPLLAAAVRSFRGQDSIVVTDPYEGPRGEPAWRPGDRLKALWFGHESNLDTLEGLLNELVVIGRRRPIELTILTGPVPDLGRQCKEFNQRWRHLVAARYERWSLDATWAALAGTDLVVIPSLRDQPAKLIKSPNRSVESLWAGRCVIANPVPAYLPFADWAFLDESIRRGLKRALDEQDRIVDRVRNAQAYIADVHAPVKIAEQWERVIADAVAAKRERVATAALVAAPANVVPRRLNLGCGDKILPGYINVDVAESRAGKKPDVICDLHRLTQFEDASIDEILSVHVVEHFWRWEVVDILMEWSRVLKPGGKLILECPNLVSACEEFLKNPDVASGPGREGQRTMWVLYGDPEWHDPLMVHRWGYTPTSLARVMEEAGFVNVRQEPAEFKLREPRDMRVVGEKPR